MAYPTVQNTSMQACIQNFRFSLAADFTLAEDGPVLEAGFKIAYYEANAKDLKFVLLYTAHASTLSSVKFQALLKYDFII